MKNVKFYLKNRHRFTFTGSPYIEFPFKLDGTDGLVVYKKWDSEGKVIPTRHPLLAQTLARVKASVNFQIKEWKEGAQQGITSPIEMVFYLNNINAPSWIWNALKSSYEKLLASPWKVK